MMANRPDRESRKFKSDSWYYLAATTCIVVAIILLVSGQLIGAIAALALLGIGTAFMAILHKIKFGRWW